MCFPSVTLICWYGQTESLLKTSKWSNASLTELLMKVLEQSDKGLVFCSLALGIFGAGYVFYRLQRNRVEIFLIISNWNLRIKMREFFVMGNWNSTMIPFGDNNLKLFPDVFKSLLGKGLSYLTITIRFA